jgi:hypothetical protein
MTTLLLRLMAAGSILDKNLQQHQQEMLSLTLSIKELARCQSNLQQQQQQQA